MLKRYDRNMRLFGIEGQETLRDTKVAVVGTGGLGTHIVQQFAHLGVKEIALIDDEKLDVTNLNRYVGTKPDDVDKYKVEIGRQVIKGINPDILVKIICDKLQTKDAFDAIINTDYVFGCLDNEGARLILNEACLAYERAYFDLASEIQTDPVLNYGGRVCFVSGDNGCLHCLGELDIVEATMVLQGKEQKKDHKDIYGVEIGDLGEKGPSVVSLNGVVASLAITEFMVQVTGIRKANTLVKYYGDKGIVTLSKDQGEEDCYYCREIKGKGDAADLYRYL